MTAREVYCRECGAAKGVACTTKKGTRASDHAVRKREAQAFNPQTGPATSPKVTENPCRDRSDDEYQPTPYDDLDDARRVLRNRTYGIVDDTLDPLDVLAEIVEGIDNTYSIEQWDEREQQYKAKLIEYGELHSKAEKRASAAETERDELRLSLVTAKDQAKAFEAEVDQLRDKLATAVSRLRDLNWEGEIV